MANLELGIDLSKQIEAIETLAGAAGRCAKAINDMEEAVRRLEIATDGRLTIIGVGELVKATLDLKDAI